MKMQECVLPVKCVKCGTTFDLWYDLISKGVGREEMAEMAGGLVDEQRLCWECRKEAFENIGVEEDVADELTLDWE